MSKDCNKKVSIIMGVYNGQDTIEKCIESIQQQTYTNWEFIICDDASTDKTVSIVQKYMSNDARIKLLKNNNNMRLAASLNRCLAVASGEYVARMDADDLSSKDRIEKQVSFLNSHPECDCVGTNRIIFDDKGEKEERKSIEFPMANVLLHDVPFAHPTIMMRKSAYDSLNGYTESKETMRAEDLDLWFRFFASGFNGYNIQEPLYLYRESVEDYKKRTVKAGIMTAKVFLNGYKLLGIPKYKWIFAIKPIISSLLPNRLMRLYHNKK